MRNRLLTPCLALFLVALGSGVASAQTDTNTVTYSVSQVSLVDIAGDVTLAITTGVAGAGLTDASTGTTYAITNNAKDQKITGSLDTDMPKDTTLKLSLQAPSSGATEGVQTLTAADVDLVTGIGAVDDGGLSMEFTLQATVNAGVVTSSSKTLTLTLTPGA